MARYFLDHVIFKLSRWWISLHYAHKIRKRKLAHFPAPQNNTVSFNFRNQRQYRNHGIRKVLHLPCMLTWLQSIHIISEFLELTTSSRATHARLPFWQLRRQTTLTL